MPAERISVGQADRNDAVTRLQRLEYGRRLRVEIEALRKEDRQAGEKQKLRPLAGRARTVRDSMPARRQGQDKNRDEQEQCEGRRCRLPTGSQPSSLSVELDELHSLFDTVPIVPRLRLG